MIRKLAEQFVGWQIEKQFLKQEDRALYQYGYEVLLNQIINILIAVLIAILLHAYVPVFVFLASYIPLRSFSGGYHSKTNGGCTAVSTLLIFLVCVSAKALQEAGLAVIWPLAFVVSGLLVFRYAPVEDRNKPLDRDEVFRYGKASRYLWLLELAGCAVLHAIQKNGQAVLTLAISHLVLSLMLCVGLLKNHYLKQHHV